LAIKSVFYIQKPVQMLNSFALKIQLLPFWVYNQS